MFLLTEILVACRITFWWVPTEKSWVSLVHSFYFLCKKWWVPIYNNIANASDESRTRLEELQVSLPLYLYLYIVVGVFFQWILCSAVMISGIIVQLIRDQPPFFPLAMVGGVIWEFGNTCNITLSGWWWKKLIDLHFI